MLKCFDCDNFIKNDEGLGKCGLGLSAKNECNCFEQKIKDAEALCITCENLNTDNSIKKTNCEHYNFYKTNCQYYKKATDSKQQSITLALRIGMLRKFGYTNSKDTEGLFERHYNGQLMTFTTDELLSFNTNEEFADEVYQRVIKAREGKGNG